MRQARPSDGHTLPGSPFRNDRGFDIDATDDRRLKAGPIDSETTQLDARDACLPTAIITGCPDYFYYYFSEGDF
jgi:hypothetical protein